jgi:AraC family transcriptional regulator, regulatory protein of adaptative response / DNA-3-methyladenine glycosylase II
MRLVGPSMTWQYLTVGSFNAVVTTGVYCLPSCNGRPNKNNVQTFELAAAAEAAGFRACLRCRPYRSQSPVSSQAAPPLICGAVRFIVDGILDEATEDDLGDQLGISGRHLRRLFIDYLGVTPDQLARSTRVHFARRLLDDSDLSIADITFAAGFGSIRQFNRECQATFRATPTELRARRRNTDRLIADGGLALRIPFQPPFDWQAWLTWTQRRAIGGVEHASHDCYRRTVVVDGDPGVVEVMPGGADHLILRAHLPHWKGLIHIVQRVRAIFNLDADIEAANRHLAGNHLVGPLVTAQPGIRPPGAWDVFEAGIEEIIGAEASIADTAATMQKIAERYGKPVLGIRALGLLRTFPGPHDIMAADLDELGLSRRSTAAIRALAGAAANAPSAMDPTRGAYRKLISGIGVATGESDACLGLRVGEPDAFPSTSTPLLQALSQRTGYPVTPQRAVHIAEAWRPWRAHAAAYLWLAQRSVSQTVNSRPPDGRSPTLVHPGTMPDHSAQGKSPV